MVFAKIDDDQAGWNKFVAHANELIESGKLDELENCYKIELSRHLQDARSKLLAGRDGWPAPLEEGISSNLIHFISKTKVTEWVENYPSEAAEALKALWTEEKLSPAERVRAFCKRFPVEVVGNGVGSRLNVASVLLMGLDVKRHPPFTITAFTKMCLRTGHPLPEKDADEAAWYDCFLGFLDRFMESSEIHGVHLRHRLDAQGLVWQLAGELPSFEPSQHDPNPLRRLAVDLHMSYDFLAEISNLLEDKRQVIFQGPPGTGKTFVAQALANCLAGAEDRVSLVQFHPSYAYEDFVRGFRPTLTENDQPGFTLQDGPLLRAAERARGEPGAKHFLIIDEINRGNLAKLFGELYFLLEYRGEKIHMQYQRDDEDDFSLPENLYIIGTMNTADRSIALVDLALRRRFYFIEFHPDVEPVKSVLRKWLGAGSEMAWVADVVDNANKLLKDDRHAAVGPSYFMKEDLDNEMVQRIWKHSVIPYVEERLFGDDGRIEQFNLDKLKPGGVPLPGKGPGQPDGGHQP